MTVIDEYRSALQRLVSGKTLIVPKGSKINNDSVALEAGRGRGSIKKSRIEFLQLIAEIDEAASQIKSKSSTAKNDDLTSKIKQLTDQLSTLKSEHATVLNKLLSTLHYNFQLQQEIQRLGGNIHLINSSFQLGEDTSDR